MDTFQVPVWFNVSAPSQDEAIDIVAAAMDRVETELYASQPNINDFVVEEAYPIEEQEY